MALQVVRYLPSSDRSNAMPHWGVVFDRFIAPVPGAHVTTGDFIREGLAPARALKAGHADIPLDSVRLLSPITANQQVVCQGINYESHVRESGMDPKAIRFNTIFTKASSCLAGPVDDVVCPKHVQLLDYEIELGLVMRCDLHQAREVRPNQLREVLAGVTIFNDVSARDVQLPQGQFYKGKSHRTFGPAGPFLLMLDPEEWLRWPDLHMRLSVNGQPRQDAYCGEMIHKPHQTLTELSGLQDLNAGDLIATGTPAGCAATAPGKAAMFVARHFLSEATKWRLFTRGGKKNPLYLQANDVMTLSIRTDDGALDLGTQRSRVVAQA